MSSNSLVEEDKIIAEINIIPFVDIILVLLIIFMVTIPSVFKTGFFLNLPKASSAQNVMNTAKLHITIHTSGQVFLNNEIFELDKVEEFLKSKNWDPKKTVATISADQNVLHGKVISVINVLHLVGLKKIVMTTKKSLNKSK